MLASRCSPVSRRPSNRTPRSDSIQGRDSSTKLVHGLAAAPETAQYVAVAEVQIRRRQEILHGIDLQT